MEKFNDKTDAINILKNVLAENNIAATDDILDKLRIYYEFLIEYNNKVNLTAITAFEDVYVKHFCDSIAMSKHYEFGKSLCDIGTGAGFPGLVLKIVRPDLKITLVDSLNKRIEFLNQLINKLNLKDVECLHYRAEDIEFKNKYLNSFDYVVARAVAAMPTLVEYCLPYVKIGGEFIAYKSDNDSVLGEINSSLKCVSAIGGAKPIILNYSIKSDMRRTLVIIKKNSATNSKYPRCQNKPRIAPII